MDGLVDGEVKFSFHCKACGGTDLTLKGDPGDMAMAYCKACGIWLGRLARIKLEMALMAKAAGYSVDGALAELVSLSKDRGS